MRHSRGSATWRRTLALVMAAGMLAGFADPALARVPQVAASSPDETVVADGDELVVEPAEATSVVTFGAELEVGVRYGLWVAAPGPDAPTVRVTGAERALVLVDEQPETARVLVVEPETSGRHQVEVSTPSAVHGAWAVQLVTGVGMPRVSVPETSLGWHASTSLAVAWATPSPEPPAGYGVVVDHDASTDPGAVTHADTSAAIELPEGESWLHVRARRTDGTWGPTAHERIRVDSVAPTLSGLRSPTHPDPDQLYAEPTVRIAWDEPEDASGVVRYDVEAVHTRDGGPIVPAQTAEREHVVELPEGGEWDLHVRAVDAAGNTGDSAVLRVSIGAVAPDLPPTPAEPERPTTSLDRMLADYGDGLLSLDELVELLVLLLTDPDALPATYTDGVDGSGVSTAAVLEVLGLLDPETREAVLDRITPGHVDPPAGQEGSGRSADPAPACEASVNPMFFPRKCTARFPDFTISYAPSAVGPVAEGEVPAAVTRMNDALVYAKRVFQEMGFTVPPGLVDVYLVEARWAYPPNSGFSAPNRTITMNVNEETRYYLPIHEYFHQVQYVYSTVLDQGSEIYWWMEATAEWAAHRAQERADYPDSRVNYYASDLRGFLDSPGPLHLGAGAIIEPGGSEYGAFVLPEYLEAQFGGDEAIRWVWDRVGDGATGIRPLDAIEEYVQSQRGSYPAAIEEFRLWTYVLSRQRNIGFSDPDAHAGGRWREAIGGETADNTYRRVTAAAAVSLGSGASGNVRVAGSNAAYIEIAVPKAAGIVRLQADPDTSADPDARLNPVRFSAIPVKSYPTLCADAQSLALTQVDFASRLDVQVHVPEGCSTLTLAITNTQKMQTWIGVDWSASWHRSTPASMTVDVSPAAVSTFVGGAQGVVDGVGAEVGFQNPAGFHVIGDQGYVFDSGWLRRVDLGSGAVTTVAGTGKSGCGVGSDPMAAQVGGAGHITDDGSFLYFVNGCGLSGRVLSRMSLSTGAISTVMSLGSVATGLVAGPGGGIYHADAGGLYRVDVVAGVRELVDSWAVRGSVRWMTADASYLWLSVDSVASSSAGPALGARVVRFDPVTGETVEMPLELRSNSGYSDYVRLTSAGDYLYATLGLQVVRIAKATGASVFVAGSGGRGDLDGVGVEAWLDGIAGLASDGRRLYVVANRRIRVLEQGAVPGGVQPPALSVTVNVSPAAVSTVAGGAQGVVDGVGAQVGFKSPLGFHVIGDQGYVFDSGWLRRVDLGSGAVTTVAGTGKASCGAGSDPMATQVSGSGHITDDGSFLYFPGNCGLSGRVLSRMSLSTGAISTVMSLGSALTGLVAGPDGDIYHADAGGLYRVDVVGGARAAVDSWAVRGSVRWMTADASYLWLSVGSVASSSAGPALGARVVRFDPVTGQAVEFPVGAGHSDHAYLTSAGDYLYAAMGPQVVQIAKATGASVVVAGSGERGDVDGIGAEAQFSGIAGLASDGRRLFVVDNGRVRTLSAARG